MIGILEVEAGRVGQDVLPSLSQITRFYRESGRYVSGVGRVRLRNGRRFERV